VASGDLTSAGTDLIARDATGPEEAVEFYDDVAYDGQYYAGSYDDFGYDDYGQSDYAAFAGNYGDPYEGGLASTYQQILGTTMEIFG
jgi:hypothetical protein